MRPAKPSAANALHYRRRRHRAILLVVLLLALCLRLWGLGTKSLWLDEIMSVENATERFTNTPAPYPKMIAHLRRFDAHPPFYQTVLWLWLHVGRGDAFVRFPSIVAGLAGVWLAYLVAKRLLGRRAALVTAFLMAISSFHIYYSQETRLNVWVVALFLGQIYLLLRIIDQRGKAGWGWWATYALLAVISLYTYVLCVLTLGALAVAYVWLTWKRRPQWIHLVAVYVIVAAVFFPWYRHVRKLTGKLEQNVAQRGDAVGRPGPGAIAGGFAAWTFGPFAQNRPRMAWPVLGGAFVIAAGIALATRRSKRPAKMLGVLFVLPMAAYLLLPMPRIQAYDPKHLIFLQPLLLMALAGVRGSSKQARGWKSTMPVLYVVVAVAALNLTTLASYYPPKTQKENWRRVFRDVDEQIQPSDAFLFSPLYVGRALEYCAQDPTSKRAVYQLTLRGLNSAGKRFVPDNDVQRIWLIECQSPVAKPSEGYRDQLANQGWYAENQVRYPGLLGYVQWTLFTRETSP